MGPLLFLVYINDLGHFFENFRPILFADDSNLITNGKNINEIEHKFKLEITKLVKWLQTNRLSLNLTKTHYMIFGTNKKKFPSDLNLEIEGVIIDEVKETKFLGIILENTLSWNSHISHISKKIAKSVGILTRARQMLNKKILTQLYYSFLYPYIMYCNVIWGNSPDKHLWQIFKLQKRAMRVIANIRRRDSTQQAFNELRILRLPELYIYSVLIFVFKFKNGLLPATFNDFFTENREYHRYPTRGATNLRAPRAKLKIASTFVKTTGTNLWNRYTPTMAQTNKIGPFKRELISILICRYI